MPFNKLHRLLTRISFSTAFLAFAVSAFSAARAEDWPCWRGPRGDGTSAEKNVPTRWDGTTGENIAWRVSLPGVGHASPVVWKDRLFVVSCLEDQQERVLICLDRRDGRQLWRRTVLKAPLETKHMLNSFASGTPATDGELVYVAFLEVDGHTIPARNVSNVRPVTPGQMVVAAYDFDGNRRWQVKPGEFCSVHGFSTCPVLHKDLVIVNGDHDGDGYLAALDKSTGETVWKTDRDQKTRSYSTPIIRTIDGRLQMLVAGSHHIASYDPDTGAQLWKIDGPTEQFVASPVFDGKLFFVVAGFPTHHVMGIRPNGSGNVTRSHVAWHETNVRCYVPSPVVVDGYLLVADDRGTANCFRAATGQRVWNKRMGKHFSASLVTAAGLVYLTSDDGITKVVRPGPDLHVVAENSLGEYCYASAAISNGQLFIRGEKHLYCIGNTNSE